MRQKAEVEQGKYTYIAGNINTFVWDKKAKVRIGKFCSIAGGLTLFLGGNHNKEWITTYPFGHIHKDVFPKHTGAVVKRGKDITIGNDVWIGSGVTILGGVTVGDGAVIAANSHIVNSVQPYSIVGGNPARLIRYRFDQSVRERLLSIKWWDLPDKEINELSPYLCSSDLDKFFDEVERRYHK